jgi:hypothetical protein
LIKTTTLKRGQDYAKHKAGRGSGDVRDARNPTLERPINRVAFKDFTTLFFQEWDDNDGN